MDNKTNWVSTMTEENSTALVPFQEEKEDGKSTAMSQRVRNAVLPPTTEYEFSDFLLEQRRLFADSPVLSHNKEQMEYFAMLPLSDYDKRALLMKLQEGLIPTKALAVAPPTGHRRTRTEAELPQEPHNRRPAHCDESAEPI